MYLHHNKCWSLSYWHMSCSCPCLVHKMCTGWHHGFCPRSTYSYSADQGGSSHTPRQTCKRCGGKYLAMLNIVHVAISFLHVNRDIMDILPICAVFCLRQKVSYPKYLLALTANENWHFGASGQSALWDLYLHPLHVCTSSSSNVMVSMGCAKYTCS